jgi:tricorn protease
MFVLWALALAPTAALAAPQFLRRPDVHGDAVVFQSEGDLWLGSIERGTAMRITSDDGVEGPAFFSPDGRFLALTAQYDGGTDIYVMDAAGGTPKRLTWDPSGATALGWTPDGKEVLFRSRREQPFRRSRLYAVPATGGNARALPIPYAEFAGISADGKRVAYVPTSAEWQNFKHYHGGQADDLWLADLATHAFRRLTDDPGVDTEPVWFGDALVFVSERGGQMNLWRLDPASGAVTALTKYADYDVRYPATDGRRVVFEHGDGLALWDATSGTTRELRFDLHSDRIHARPRVVAALPQLASVAFGPSGKRLLVSSRGQILSAPVENGEVRVVATQSASRCQRPAWSPDGRRAAFVSDASGEEQLWLASSNGGEPSVLTHELHGQLGTPMWSPDGKRLAITDREMRVMLVDAATGAVTQVDQADRGGSYDLVNETCRFSPDGRWLAYAKAESNWNWAIYLYEIASRRKTRVTDPEMGCNSPVFDPSGKFLYWLADRSFDPRYVDSNRFFAFDKITKVTALALTTDTKSPFLLESDEEGGDAKSGPAGAGKPGAKTGAAKADSTAKSPPVTRVDLEGIGERIFDVPAPADHYARVEPVEGRLLLSTSGEDGQLRAFDLKKKEVKVLVKKLTDFQVSADRKKVLVQDGKNFTVMDAGADSPPEGKGKVETGAWNLTVDPQAEWRQMFYETWRVCRDFFYDPKMHGADWNAVRVKYERLLPAVADRTDLSSLQGQVVGELRCGHAYIRGGDVGGPKPLPMGYLGADFEFVPGSTPAYRVTKMLRGDGFDFEGRSPLLAPGLGIRVGDFLLAVSGRPAHANEDLQALLAGTADQVVSLTVNDRPSFAGSRQVRVKPMASERTARYLDWVAGRAEYVRKSAGENFAYLHTPNMSQPGLTQFGKHYYPNVGKDALVVDVRFNTGGNIDAMMLLQMSHRPYSWFKPRYGASWTRQDWGFSGHFVTLCNDQSFSDAEEFADAFQRLKLGPVIGTRTWGGEVGSGGGYPLLDGGLVYVPSYGEWVPGGQWVIEGEGVTPDIVVEDDPAALMAGRDPQLDRAIAYLKSELQREPVRRPEPPPFPVKSR